MVDKNQAIIDYLIQCPNIVNSPLYFNLINAKNDNVQIITRANDTTMDKPFIDGSIPKQYTFTIIVFKSISENPIVTEVGTGYTNENIDDLADAQALLDWVVTQQELRNFPDFGEDCYVDDIQTTTNVPRLEGINDELTPPLAMYSIGVIVNYIDTSKMIWKENDHGSNTIQP